MFHIWIFPILAASLSSVIRFNFILLQHISIKSKSDSSSSCQFVCADELTGLTNSASESELENECKSTGGDIFKCILYLIPISGKSP